MSDEEINIAIAEALGATWTHEGVLTFCGRAPRWSLGPMRTEIEDGRVLAPEIPNYCNDLNAMHEAELGLDDAKYDAFQKHLLEIVSPKTHWSDMAITRIVSASASQRAEAFIKTLNLENNTNK